jgi:hypothetical protein
VPTHNSFRPDDGYGIKNARKATIEPNEQGAVGPAQIQSTWCALSKHVQLMTQNQKFSVKPPSRLDAIAHHADEKEGDCDHQRGSCSDSGTAATPADGVFGSDSGAYMTGVSTSSRATNPGLFVGLGPLARDYILDTDGTGDFRMRAVRSYRENGQLY